jgi:hypothetical protein
VKDLAQELEAGDLVRAVGKGAKIPAGVSEEELRGLERGLREQVVPIQRSTASGSDSANSVVVGCRRGSP